MGMLDFLKKTKEEESFTETIPNAKLHIIEGGAHGFSKKHDVVAMAHLRRFAGQ